MLQILLSLILFLSPSHYSEGQLVKARITNAGPILSWSGAAAGSQNMLTNSTLDLTTTGTYSMTVTRPVTLSFQLAAAGANGQSGAIGGNGGYGGGSGAISNAINVSLVSGTTYELRIGAANSTLSSYFRIPASTIHVEAGAGSGINAGSMSTGAGTNGKAGGGGGTFGSVDPNGAAGQCSTNGLGSWGSGGGGGTSGSTELGGGGSGGCLTNGTSGHGAPPGDGDDGNVGLALSFAGASVSCGGRGGHGGDGTNGAGGAGCPGAARILFVSIP